MPRVHNLDIYPCDGTRHCLGCVPVFASEASGVAQSPAPASTRAERAYQARPQAPAPAAAPRAATTQSLTPRALFAACWSARRLRVDTAVTLTARTDNVPAETAATITVRGSGGETVDAFTVPTTDTGLHTRWMPPGPGRYTFTVEAAGREARSRVLEVLGWVELTVVDARTGAPMPVAWELTSSDGTTRTGDTGPDGTLHVDDLPDGDVILIIRSALESDDAAAESHRAAPLHPGVAVEMTVGTPNVLAACHEHVISLASDLVLSFRRPRSQVLESSVWAVLHDAHGVELARRALADHSEEHADSVHLVFPEASGHAEVGVTLEMADGTRYPLVPIGSPSACDVRVPRSAASSSRDLEVHEGARLEDVAAAFGTWDAPSESLDTRKAA